MQAIHVVLCVLKNELVRKVVMKRRGPRGHGILRILRLLLYAVLMEIFSTRKLMKHLRKRPSVWRNLGFTTCPSKRSIDRWKKKYEHQLEYLIRLVGDWYTQLNESEWTVLDSTPLQDPEDPDARKGYTSRGEFWGFKVHMSCDEYRVPLRATFTTGNVHDAHEAFILLAPTKNTGGDSAYDFEDLKIMVANQGGKPYFVHNPRREGAQKKKPTPRKLKKVRICIEQCNGILKNDVMCKAWKKVKGYAAKATFALLSVLALQAFALYNLITTGYPSLKINELRI